MRENLFTEFGGKLLATTVDSALEVMNSVLPETGEMRFQDFELAVRAKNHQALGMFHTLRRAGRIGARNQKREGGGLVLFVSRVGGNQ